MNFQIAMIEKDILSGAGVEPSAQASLAADCFSLQLWKGWLQSYHVVLSSTWSCKKRAMELLQVKKKIQDFDGEWVDILLETKFLFFDILVCWLGWRMSIWIMQANLELWR